MPNKHVKPKPFSSFPVGAIVALQEVMDAETEHEIRCTYYER